MDSPRGILSMVALLGGILSSGAEAQTQPPPAAPPSESPQGPPALKPSDSLPTQSPAAPTSPGAIVIQYKLELLDKDGDGKVSRAEAAGVPDLLKIFDKLDRNGDGMLDAGELAEHNKGSLGAK